MGQEELLELAERILDFFEELPEYEDNPLIRRYQLRAHLVEILEEYVNGEIS